MRAPMNGGTRPTSVAIATSHGSSTRRFESLYTQTATASQKTATKKSARLRTIAHVPVLMKSKAPLAVICSYITSTLRSEKELPDEITGAEREAHNHDDHDHGDREDAQPLAEPCHRTDSNR